MLQRRSLLWAGLGSTALGMGLVGCAEPNITDYANETPKLDMQAYFNGMIDAWGMFTDRNGKVVKRFTVEMNCSWQAGDGVLDEHFSYSDGTKEQRVWHLQALGNGQYTGTAGDVVGVANGQAQGNAFNWRYTLALPVSGTVLNVQMDDWMYLMSERVILNKTRMTKLGIHLGDVTLSFTKRSAKA